MTTSKTPKSEHNPFIVPKKLVRQLFGFANDATADRFAEKWGAPIRGRMIDLREVIQWMHNTLDDMEAAKRWHQRVADKFPPRRRNDGRFSSKE